MCGIVVFCFFFLYQLLLSQCPWKEYTADNGKIYYHNVTTKESKWVIPPELDEIKKKIAAEEYVFFLYLCCCIQFCLLFRAKSTPTTPAEVMSPLAVQTATISPNIAASKLASKNCFFFLISFV